MLSSSSNSSLSSVSVLAAGVCCYDAGFSLSTLIELTPLPSAPIDIFDRP